MRLKHMIESTVYTNTAAGAEARDRSTKDNLFRAAVCVFAEKGFAAATVREICARAGANVAAVNYHFGSKEKLYEAVLDFIMAGPGERPARAAALAGPPEARLAAYVRAFVRCIYQPREGFAQCQAGSVFLFEMARPTSGLDRIVERYIRPDAEALKGILAELLGSAATPHTVRFCAESLVGQLLYRCTMWPISQRLAPGQEPDQAWMEDVAEHVLRFSLAGIAAVRRDHAPGGPPPGRGIREP